MKLLKTVYKNNNIIISHRPLSEIEGSENIIFSDKASNCCVYLAPRVRLSAATIKLCGNNAAFFAANTMLGKISCSIFDNSTVYIGDSCFINPYLAGQLLYASECTNLIIGNNCIISTGVEISTTDVHLVYDRRTRTRRNRPQSIYIGDHVWIGRETKVYKGAKLASGGVLAARAVATGGFYPGNSIIAGLPAKVLRTSDIYWDGTDTFSFTPQDTEKNNYHESDNEVYLKSVFEHSEKEVISPVDLDVSLKALPGAYERIAFLYDTLFSKAEHNRFFWSDEDISKEALDFSTKVGFSAFWEDVRAAVPLVPTTPVKKPIYITREELILVLNKFKIRRSYFYYSLMSYITFNKKKKHYVQKKCDTLQKLKIVELVEKSIGKF